MKTLSGYLDDAYSTWLGAALGCCSSESRLAPRYGQDAERHMKIEHYQPRLIPSPIPEPQERPTTRGREWASRSRSFASRASSRGSFSVRRKLNAYNGPRRPRIGAPSDFRVVENALPKRQRRSGEFRPLELSIYMPERQLSPIMSHFGDADNLTGPESMKDLPYPPSARCHSRTESGSSFSIPRKPLRSGSSRASSEWTAQFQPRPESISAQELLAKLENEMPKPPPPARLRAMTEPPTYERIKSALHEKFELEQRLRDIDEVIEERRSVYFNSRPTSRATSRARSIYAESQEPMPSPPAINPSFATRVSSPTYNQRPQTAPSKAIHIPSRLKSFSEASSAFSPPAPSPPPKNPLRLQPQPPQDPIPPPPLPLVLQAPHPPLRKKKSFSRVSNWLSRSNATEDRHSRNLSLDSVTNTPKPVTSRDGFYQCVDVPQQDSYSYNYNTRRDSVDSVTTVSTLESDVDGDEEGFAQRSVTITPESSPGRAKGNRGFELRRDSEKSVELERTTTFGERQVKGDEKWRMDALIEKGFYVPGRNSVGVAF